MNNIKRYQYQVNVVNYFPYKEIIRGCFDTLKEAKDSLKGVDDRVRWRFGIKKVIKNEA